MALTRIPYTEVHFTRIRDFLVETYQATSGHHNWHIDRWNFCRHVSQTIHEIKQYFRFHSTYRSIQ